MISFEFEPQVNDLREKNLVVANDLEPVCSFDVDFLVTLVQAQHLQQVLPFRGCENFTVLWEVWNEQKNEGRDYDSDYPF